MMRKKRGAMDFNLFKRIVHRLPSSVYRVWLMKQGETLLHRHFGEFAKYLKEKRPEITIQLATNAALLTKEKAEIMVKYLDYLDIGIHGITAETYEKIAGRKTFEKVIKNLEYLDSLIGASKATLIYNLTYVRQPLNSHETNREVELFFKDRFNHFNRLVLKWESNFQGEIGEANLAITKEAEHFPKCILPYTTIAFLYDGNISYCPAESRENYFVGNILNESMEEVWNGFKMRELRRLLMKEDYDSLDRKGMFCRACTWPWSFEVQNPQLFVSHQGSALMPLLEKRSFLGIEDFLEAGFIYYLNSKLSDAYEMFSIASLIHSSHQHLVRMGKKWKGEVERVHKMRYANIELWEKKLNAENKSFGGLERIIIENERKR
jgi:hypothetical protein